MNVYVFLPARDEEKHLPATLNSIANQTLKPSKIVLINDASIDRTIIPVQKEDGCLLLFGTTHFHLPKTLIT